MKKWKCLLALLIMASGCTAQPQPTPSSEPAPDTAGLTQTADQLAEMLVSQLGAASVQYALMDGDTILVSGQKGVFAKGSDCLLYTSPSPRDRQKSRMPSSA